MTSIKVKFRPHADAHREGTVYYQIIHKRKPRRLLTSYKAFPSEWDGQRSTVALPPDSERKAVLLSIREHIRMDVERIVKIIRKLDDGGLDYATENIICEFRRHTAEYTLFNFMASLIEQLKRNGKIRTSETYTTALRSFRKFRNNEDIMLDSINSADMEAYQAWQKSRGNTPNTISFYMRILRAVYNRAIEEEIIENRQPFRQVYTGVDKTVKRALPLQMIKKIKNLDLTRMPSLDFARDMFLISFMLRRMSFIDMAYLKKTDLADGYITCRRHKTGQLLVIEWTKEMTEILKKYPPNDSDYLLPIIRCRNTDERCTYRNVGYYINHNLKKIAAMVGLSIPLTLYVARHSWASVAQAKGIPLAIISEGMGHDSETITRIYLAGLDTTAVDKANSIILKSLQSD